MKLRRNEGCLNVQTTFLQKYLGAAFRRIDEKSVWLMAFSLFWVVPLSWLFGEFPRKTVKMVVLLLERSFLPEVSPFQRRSSLYLEWGEQDKVLGTLILTQLLRTFIVSVCQLLGYCFLSPSTSKHLSQGHYLRCLK